MRHGLKGTPSSHVTRWMKDTANPGSSRAAGVVPGAWCGSQVLEMHENGSVA